MKKRIKKGFFLQEGALFMLFLVLTIPFFSAQVFAASITGVTITGSDGIENVMQSDNDYFVATVETSEEIDPDQLYISYTKEEAFDSCSGTTCTYTSTQTDRAGQEIPYTISLIEDDTVTDEATGTILVDEEEPTIEDYTVEQDGEDITISYEIEDTACDDCTSCAGIDYLTLYQDETELEQINVASQCSYEDTLETTISELNLEDGDHELCLIAVDNLGHESDDACGIVSVDTQGPHFETGSLQIFALETGTPVEYIGTDAVLSTISINVSDPSLNPNTVTADFSGLNGIIGSTYANLTAHSCTQESDDETLYVCTWNNIYIEEVSGAITLHFYAQDNEENEGAYTPTWTLVKDETAPVVVRVYTASSQESDDIYLKSGTNSLYADIDPTGSAFAFENVAMTFGLASLSNMDATECWENGSSWTCIWNFTMSYSGTTSSTLSLTGEDDAGNAMVEYTVDVQTDSSEPEILSITISLDCPTAMDTLMIEVNATDDSDSLFLTFYGNDVRTNDDPIIEECIDVGEDLFTCTLSVNDLVSYPEDEDVDIEISDLAGNIADDEVDVSVCELEESGTPNLVTLSLGDFAAVDKLTLSYIDYPLYIPVTFSMTSGAHIVGKTASCENAGNVYFIDQSERESFMVVTLPQQVVGNATFSLAVDCSVYLTMQYGESVYVNPEVEEVVLDVELYGTPLGSIEGSVAEKVELQKMGIAEAQARIDKWVTANRILGTFCTIIQIWTKANAIYGVLHGVGAAMMYWVYTEPAGTAITKLMTKLDQITLRFLWFPGYGAWRNVGTVVKYGCIIYSGKLCEGYNSIENYIGISADAGTPASYDAETEYNTQLTSGESSRQQQNAEQFEDFVLFYDWDPYKSIHTARNCLYIDALIYNLRKERQINCMYTTCLEENSKNGLPIDICDVQFSERQCLYVDGAAWKAAGWGGFGHFVQVTLNTVFSNLDIWGLSNAYYGTCYAYLNHQVPEAMTGSFFGFIGQFIQPVAFDSSTAQTQTYFAFCHIMGATISMSEVGWFTKGSTDFNFQAELEGTDYCVGY